jgi:ABC-type sugar transport system ATPase subunit
MGEREALLKLRDISKAYGSVQAIQNVDFDAYEGEVIALVGDNGAGKSTLVKVISGAHKPDSGEISFEGKACHFDTPLDAKRLGIEIVYQNLGLLENLSITANIFLGREERVKLFGRYQTPFMNFRAMDKQAHALLKQYSMTVDSPKRHVAKLSGGQRQMVAIARGAGWGSRMIVMDEPTAALGVQESKKVLDLVKRLRERGIGVIIISHNLEHVFDIADRITVLRRGQVVGTVKAAESSPSEVVHLITGAGVVDRSLANTPA